MHKILAISASTMGTKSRLLVDHFQFLFNGEVEIEIFDFKEHELMFADGRDYRDFTGSTQTLITKILEADALVISHPVYQASIPGSLKNMFDLLPINSLQNKSVAIITSAGSDKHFLVPEYQLKPILKYMKAQIVEPNVFVHANHFLGNELNSDDVELRLEQLSIAVIESVEEMKERQRKIDEAFDF